MMQFLIWGGLLFLIWYWIFRIKELGGIIADRKGNLGRYIHHLRVLDW